MSKQFFFLIKKFMKTSCKSKSCGDFRCRWICSWCWMCECELALSSAWRFKLSQGITIDAKWLSGFSHQVVRYPNIDVSSSHTGHRRGDRFSKGKWLSDLLRANLILKPNNKTETYGILCLFLRTNSAVLCGYSYYSNYTFIFKENWIL